MIDFNQFENMGERQVLSWALEKYGERIALASSFGAEDVVLVDMLAKINQTARIFTLDTGRLNQETYDVMDAIRQKYDIKIETFLPNAESVEMMVQEHGFNLFYDSIEKRELCCNVRKTEPLKRALKTVDAWLTGLRREQSITRADVKKVEYDEANNLIKVNPLVEWTEKQVWDYIKENNVPYNALHDRGFPSIGCAPCTRAIESGEDIRAGRWWWETPEQKECGLHVKK